MQIQNLIQADMGCHVSYWKALAARREAHEMIRGTAEGSYAMIHSYCHMLEQTNPGTYTCVATEDENRFKYVFIAYGACIAAVQSLRKVCEFI